MTRRNDPPEDNGPPAVHPLLALAVSVGLAAATGLLADWPAAVTVFVTTAGLFGAQGVRDARRRASDPE